MKPTVSVVMPVYNADRFVAAAVESVLAQTYTDYEFIIIDDGSTDGSTAILREFASRERRIRLVSRPNTGYVVALNDGLALAHGEYVARMDADDICLPGRFDAQVRALRMNGRLALVGGSVIMIDQDGRYLTRLDPPGDDRAIQEVALKGHTPICHPTAMMRRDLVEQVGGYDPGMILAEDLDLYLKLGELGELANVPEVVLKYRQHAGSVSETAGTRQMDVQRRACQAAWKRRGITGTFERSEHWRPLPGRESQYRFALRYGWWAFNSGERRTALLYGARAIRQRPLGAEGWRLIACAAVKPLGRRR